MRGRDWEKSVLRERLGITVLGESLGENCDESEIGENCIEKEIGGTMLERESLVEQSSERGICGKLC